MKILVIGGTEGIGSLISKHFDSTAISRRTGHSVPENNQTIKDLSRSFDVIINCIPDINQNIILEELWQDHTEQGLSTYFITVGSMSWRINTDEHPKKRLYNFSEKLIYDNSKLRHTLVNLTWCYNCKDQALLSKISENQILDCIKFLIDQIRFNTVISMIELKGK